MQGTSEAVSPGGGPFPQRGRGQDVAHVVSQVEEPDFEDFKARLVASGVKTERFGRRRSSFGVTKTLKDLHTDVILREASIAMEDGKAVQHVEIVKVYVLADVGGEMCCLIEHDQFDLKDGGQRAVMRPLQKKMRSGEEDWREAMRSAFRDLVGVDEEWQEAHLEVNEETYRYHEERTASLEYPDLPTQAKVHEVYVRVKQSVTMRKFAPMVPSFIEDEEEDMEDPLEQVGLPSGRDFVTREVCPVTRQVRLHVWCWKSREYERNSRLLEFGEYLTSCGVDINQFGIGSAKTLFQFYLEVKERKESCLQVCANDNGPRLQRVLQCLKVKLIAEVHKRKRVLSIAEQFMDDSRQRQVQKLPVIKLGQGETEKQALENMLVQRLGIEPSVQAALIEEDKDKEEYTEDWKPSEGYAGIPSFYKIRTVTLTIRDPQSEHFLRLGLPRGNDFVTREGSLGEQRGQGKINVWAWLPLMEEDQFDDTPIAGTALEELSRNLHDVEDLIHQTCRHPDVAAAGLDRPLNTALQKIRWCSERSSNIDDTLAEIDVNAMMNVTRKRGSSEGAISSQDTRSTAASSSGTSRGDLAGLADFITSNFTRQPERGSHDVMNLNESLHALAQEAERRASLEEESPGSPQCIIQSPVMKFIFDNLDSWGLDMFDINDRSNSRVIEVYGEVALVQQCESALGCKLEVLRKFLEKVQSLYFDNPYHNALHAVQVCHSACWLTRNFGLVQHQSELERAVFAISTLCHDVKHFGVNNMFLINSEHSLAILYNNSKVLENMHAAQTWELLQTSGGGTSMLGKLSREDRAAMRSQIIEYILATDMSEHFEVISKFRVKLEASDFSVQNEADRRFVARMCMKSGDIGHSALPWELHANWSMRVQTEFFKQGDEETRLGLPVSALCERAKVKDASSYANSQKGFLEFVCLPLFNVLVAAHKSCSSGSEFQANVAEKQGSERQAGEESTEASDSEIQQNLVGNAKANQTNWLEDMAMRDHVQKNLLDVKT